MLFTRTLIQDYISFTTVRKELKAALTKSKTSGLDQSIVLV